MSKQMIEEMAKEIEHAKQGIWASVIKREEDEDYLWHSRRIAKHLTGVGYQKVDKDKQIVLSKEEYEILLSNADNAFQDGLNESRELYKQEVETEIRKETAEKIFNNLLKEFYKRKSCGNADVVVYEIAKQFGVEIKELNL